MAYTRTAISANLTMLEQFREMENSLREISSLVGRAGKILSTVGNAKPETYLSAIRAIRALQEAWSHHLEVEHVLFPRMLCCKLQSGEFLKRLMERDQAIGKRLEAILSAPWPRSPHSGVQSLKSAAGNILNRILIQVECGQALILSAIPRMDRRMPDVERVESEPSELVTI
ncbi:MAG TPA: hypothetical protein VFO86_12590 [Terriglobia bacterium]|nr:hypothetical protein [Terriglobia bacterium]